MFSIFSKQPTIVDKAREETLEYLKHLGAFFDQISLEYSDSPVPTVPYLQMSSEYYTQVSNGIWVRMVKDIDNLLNDKEIKVYDDIFHELILDFDKCHVMLVKMNTGGFFPFHKHPSIETMYCAKGKFKVVSYTDDKKTTKTNICNEGESCTVDALVNHNFLALENGWALSILNKT